MIELKSTDIIYLSRGKIYLVAAPLPGPVELSDAILHKEVMIDSVRMYVQDIEYQGRKINNVGETVGLLAREVGDYGRDVDVHPSCYYGYTRPTSD